MYACGLEVRPRLLLYGGALQRLRPRQVLVVFFFDVGVNTPAQSLSALNESRPCVMSTAEFTRVHDDFVSRLVRAMRPAVVHTLRSLFVTAGTSAR